MISDVALAAKVVTELGVQELRHKGNIDVRSAEGIVQLSGEVDSEETKQAVEGAALSVIEVVGVDNQLQVKA